MESWPGKKTWIRYFTYLLNIQNDVKDNTQNNRVPENDSTSDKVLINMLNLEIAVTHEK
jgi:hypothetical protein